MEASYRELLEEMNIEVVALWGPWVFLRRRASEGKFELYSDIDSRIEQYEKIKRVFKIVSVMEIICLALEMLGAAMGTKVGYLWIIIMGIFAIAFTRMTYITNDIIVKLKEEKGEMVNSFGGLRKGIRICMAAGWICYLISLFWGGVTCLIFWLDYLKALQ